MRTIHNDLDYLEIHRNEFVIGLVILINVEFASIFTVVGCIKKSYILVLASPTNVVMGSRVLQTNRLLPLPLGKSLHYGKTSFCLSVGLW